MPQEELSRLPHPDCLTARQKQLAALVRTGLFRDEIVLVLGRRRDVIDSDFAAIYETLGISVDPLTLAAYAEYHHLRFLPPNDWLRDADRIANP